jgi:hypothetical protein
MQLTANEIEPMLSAYLLGGWRDDDLQLKSVDLEPDSITALLRVTRFFLPGDGRFHLSLLQAFIWVGQLALIHGCWDNRLDRKPGEIFIRSMTLECKRPVSNVEDLSFHLKSTSKRLVKGGVFYSGVISIDHGAFVGSGRYVFPLLASRRATEEIDDEAQKRVRGEEGHAAARRTAPHTTASSHGNVSA